MKKLLDIIMFLKYDKSGIEFKNTMKMIQENQIKFT